MKSNREFDVSSDDVKILDGGLATELTKLGFKIDDDPLWSARLLFTSPDTISKVHERYLEAGSDVIITSSYQTSIPILMEYGHCSEVMAQDYIKSTVTIAKDACKDFWQNHSERRYPLVAGSVGPYGACQHDGSEYNGTYVDSMTIEELMNWHRPRLAILVDSGADLIAIETIPALKEALALAKLLKEFPATKAWITFSCKNAEHLCHGEKFSEAVLALSSFDQVFGVGVNCTNPEHVQSLLMSLKENGIAKDKIKVVYPNSGELWMNGGWTEEKSLKTLANYAPAWINAGATWIGGCCRTSPDDIRSLRECLKMCS